MGLDVKWRQARFALLYCKKMASKASMLVIVLMGGMSWPAGRSSPSSDEVAEEESVLYSSSYSVLTGA